MADNSAGSHARPPTNRRRTDAVPTTGDGASTRERASVG
ncbi:hypothetical protein LI99_06600 [Mycolicibacterium smegmatis]|uniref:Uncharacterized protein n=1 Tax=Mycolicibacterium smegmatis (strain ATCC 700084 / mc(2)155) TaxID=246196 RepID=A0QS26_MYCS2|nr:hypothetical protein MSMEG_1324 [Mycolicibacterium smegmatis MC2 155]AIU13191.1 hypothetical protein LI99_06600 [Mycolicibacterium smegmatis]AIU06566.1 hypothetical protein LJ00_06600 [Mycolicibacterium smegmatis MC2 155]AIU19815.1 hypothetical protein LI98_06600 [Mycolicibacterium smegmatis]TBH31824.1 hypothetical protein EYS45_25005 [Mycolicibacterium smegmatis MC2 155]